MKEYCQNLLDILIDEEKYTRLFTSIVDFIVAQNSKIDVSDRKCFERKETTDYLLSKVDELNAT